MMIYYGAGWYANIALAVNLLFLLNFGKFSGFIAWYSRYRFDDGYSSGCQYYLKEPRKNYEMKIIR
jgi:hypothetical protein